MSPAPATPAERYDYGRSLRKATPREDHAEYAPASNRPDPVALLEDQNKERLQWLLPVRRARMAVSPFAFYRGGARIMAADLAPLPVSGLGTQLCGDAHLANFGVYASPERRLVFDINDFDETLPGPFEWDVKRLAASLHIAARHNGLGKKGARRLTARVVRTYCRGMRWLAEMRRADIWYAAVSPEKLVASIGDRKRRKRAHKILDKARRKTSRQALDKLAEEVNGSYRIRSEPPLLIPMRDVADRTSRDGLADGIDESFEAYLHSLPDHVEHLLRGYRMIDMAVKVVGVGSVGTRCAIVLLQGRDRNDPLFLQVKEAGRSVLEEHLPSSRYETSGQRVVAGQRLMQTVSDIFLGHSLGGFSGAQYYWRQLKDWKYASDVEHATAGQLTVLAEMRGRALARAHARAGDPIAIAGYLGKGKAFEQAMVAFAQRYAAQNQADFEAFTAAIDSGRLEAGELPSA